MRKRFGALLTFVLVACASDAPPQSGGPPASAPGEMQPENRASANTSYLARLLALNSTMSGGEAMGEARFDITGDSLIIRIEVQGAPPEIAHWQHIHGFTDSRTSACPQADADVNGDGIIDLIETEPAAGTTMVPFNADPIRLAIPEESYPIASADGSYHYEKTVSLHALNAAISNQFDGQSLDLERRVIFVHGVPAETDLPTTVASLGPIPAQTTLPIACGMIERRG